MIMQFGVGSYLIDFVVFFFFTGAVDDIKDTFFH